MCSTCGCEKGEVHIEGDDAHGHVHSHDHEHTPHTLGEERVVQVIHHHYHHQGNVEHHYHYYGADFEAQEECEHDHCCDEHDEEYSYHEHSGHCCHGHEDHAEYDHFHPDEGDEGDLHYGHGEAGTHAPGITQKRMFEIEMSVLDKNNKIAAHNREHFEAQNILALNLVSSPGSGKTTLLTETIELVKNAIPCAVIEGDQQTSNDADRIRATGVPAIQVNTGKGCHLDAQMVHDAAHRLQLSDNSLLFIENVGNLVCPAGFDLGERAKVVVLSVTEGEDKPLKYPHMFAAAKLMLLNKVDLLPYVSFDVEACVANARRVNPNIVAILISATTGQGMDTWAKWLEQELSA